MLVKTVWIGILGSLLLLTACQNKAVLNDVFSCKIKIESADFESVNEYQNNFTVHLPKYWKTELYSIGRQSGIISADTTKVITESYKIDFSIVNENLNISKNLSDKVKNIILKKNLKTVKSGFHEFKGKPAFFHLAYGKENEFPFRVFQYYIKLDDEKYLLIKSEFYGEEAIDTRICEAISLVNNLKITTNTNK